IICEFDAGEPIRDREPGKERTFWRFRLPADAGAFPFKYQSATFISFKQLRHTLLVAGKGFCSSELKCRRLSGKEMILDQIECFDDFGIADSKSDAPTGHIIRF